MCIVNHTGEKKRKSSAKRELSLTAIKFSFATTSPRQPVLWNTKIFQVKSLNLEPLVSDHFLKASASS